jgi:hypothetical protein
VTNPAAAALHRRLDEAMGRAIALDGRRVEDGDGGAPERPGALIPPRLRRKDLSTMTDRPNPPKVLVLKLAQRTSGRGTVYLSGWMGQARLVGFPGDPDEHGNPTWLVYASEPQPRPASGEGGSPRGPGPAREAPPRAAQRPVERGAGWSGSRYRRLGPSAPTAPPEGFDDGLEELGRR